MGSMGVAGLMGLAAILDLCSGFHSAVRWCWISCLSLRLAWLCTWESTA